MHIRDVAPHLPRAERTVLVGRVPVLRDLGEGDRMTGRKGYRGQPPSLCPKEILEIVSSNGGERVGAIHSALGHKYCYRTIQAHLHDLNVAGKIERVNVDGNMRTVVYRVKRK